jgi:cell division protein FtsZ
VTTTVVVIVRELVQTVATDTDQESSDGTTSDRFGTPQITVVGADLAGIDTLARLPAPRTGGLETVAVGHGLDSTVADTTVTPDGCSRGDAAGCPSSTRDTLVGVLRDADLVFVVTGAGDTAVSDCVIERDNQSSDQPDTTAAVATAVDTLDGTAVGLVSSPADDASSFENRGFETIVDSTDSTFVLDAPPQSATGSTTTTERGGAARQTVAETVARLAETITEPSLIGLDYGELLGVLEHGGVGRLSVGEATGGRRVREAVANATSETIPDSRGWRRVFVHLTGGPDLTLAEAERAVERVTAAVEADRVGWTALVRERDADRLRVTCLLAGDAG